MKKFVFSILVFVLLAVFMDACKKKQDPIDPEVLELNDNVKIVSTTGLTLNVGASNFANGTYVFSHFGSDPRIEVGDILVSGEGDGYIRKIVSFTFDEATNTYTIETTQGTLEDVFKQGRLIFNVDLNFMSPGKGSGLFDTVLQRTLYNDASLNVVLNSALIRYAPNFIFNMLFDSSGLSTCDIRTSNSNYVQNATIRVRATQARNLIGRTDTLRKYLPKLYVKWNLVSGYPTPVVVRLDLSWVARIDTIATTLTDTNTFFSNIIGRQTLGINYIKGGQWTPNYNFNPTGTISTTQRAGTQDVLLKLTCRPVLAFKIMGVPGPFLTVDSRDSIISHLNTGTGDWDINMTNHQETFYEVKSTILGYNVPDFGPKQWETPKMIYSAPSELEKVSGDNQRAPENRPLPNLVKVKVKDSNGAPVGGVRVQFNVTSPTGTVTPSSIKSDASGFAQANWQLGNRLTPLQHLEASVKRGDQAQTDINFSPMEFSAYIDTPVSCGSMTDASGNTSPAVIIGGKCWTTTNLRTKKYANGSDLPKVYDPNSLWTSTGNQKTGAYTDFASDPTYGQDYGRIYNWYAVNDTNVCAAGWHVPTISEYQLMFDSLKGVDSAGRYMKYNVVSNETWLPTLDANNVSGFKAISVAWRDEAGNYSITDFTETYFWTSTSFDSNNAYAIRLRNSLPKAFITQSPKNRGYQVRCVRD